MRMAGFKTFGHLIAVIDRTARQLVAMPPKPNDSSNVLDICFFQTDSSCQMYETEISFVEKSEKENEMIPQQWMQLIDNASV